MEVRRERIVEMRKELRFACEYVANGGDASAAYRECIRSDGTKAQTAARARQLLKDPSVIAKIVELHERMDKAAVLTGQEILERFTLIANADLTKLSRVVRRCCRYCYGAGHHYQWRDEVELTKACEKAKKDKVPAPLPVGGFGFNATRCPHPECPQCDGAGSADVEIPPASTYGVAERAAYLGAKVGKHGIEVSYEKPSDALKLLAQAQGLLAPKAPEIAPPSADVPAVPADPVEASKTYAEFLRD